jgi:hypothetical protein
MVHVKTPGLFMQGMHNQGADSGFVSEPSRAQDRVAQQIRAQSLAMARASRRGGREPGPGPGRACCAESPRGLSMVNGTCRQRVVALDRAGFIHDNKGACGA